MEILGKTCKRNIEECRALLFYLGGMALLVVGGKDRLNFYFINSTAYMDKNILTNCFNCDGERNHEPLHIKKVTPSLTGDVPYGNPAKIFFEYMLLQCKGCNAISFLIRENKLTPTKGKGKNYHDENFPEHDQLHEDGGFLTKEEKRTLPKKILALYEEVQLAFVSEANMLAGVGLRMLIEAICLDQNIVGKNLPTKIMKLHDAGFIAKKDVPILDILRDIGNVSAHEIRAFSIIQLSYALDIIDHVLKSIYFMPAIQKKLKGTK